MPGDTWISIGTCFITDKQVKLNFRKKIKFYTFYTTTKHIFVENIYWEFVEYFYINLIIFTEI